MTTTSRKGLPADRGKVDHGEHHTCFKFEGKYHSHPPKYILSNLRHWVDTCKPGDTRDYVISKVEAKLRQNHMASEFPPIIRSRILTYAAYRHSMNQFFAWVLAHNGVPPQERRR